MCRGSEWDRARRSSGLQRGSNSAFYIGGEGERTGAKTVLEAHRGIPDPTLGGRGEDVRPGAWESDFTFATGQLSPPSPQAAPTSLPRDGGGVDVETGEFPDFLFRQGVGIGLIYSQFLTMKGEICDRF